jgi:hypothetical protein
MASVYTCISLFVYKRQTRQTDMAEMHQMEKYHSLHLAMGAVAYHLSQ